MIERHRFETHLDWNMILVGNLLRISIKIESGKRKMQSEWLSDSGKSGAVCVSIRWFIEVNSELRSERSYFCLSVCD